MATSTARARAFWVAAPGHGVIREEQLPPPAAGEVLVRARHSGISRGTEALVFAGRVPATQREVMRAPFQRGDFPGPVKYGYLSVGTVQQGPAGLRGRTVFCLHPHQTAYVVPAAAVTPVPDAVPPRRAVLAGTVETALNAVWDLGPLPGDRVSVVGAGMVGCCTARLLARFPGVDVELVDVDPTRGGVADALGVAFAEPAGARHGRDAVVHASATEAGLRLALDLLDADGSVLELSWYGDTEVTLPLGAAFHAGRLRLRASQVGAVSIRRRLRRTPAERMALALDLLRDEAFDALLTGESTFEELPELMPRLVSGEVPALCHSVTYPTSAEAVACTA